MMILSARPTGSQLPVTVDQPLKQRKPALSNSTSLPNLQSLKRDMVHFSGKDKTEAAKSPAVKQSIETLLDQCDLAVAPQRMSFYEFLAKTQENPDRYLPTASSYFLDAFQHFDGPQGPQFITAYGEKMPRYSIMNAAWANHLADPPKVHGHEPTVKRILEIVSNFKQQSNPDRAIALFGPHGSGKSMIPKTIMAGLEHYSRQDQGALWTYQFVFPNEQVLQKQNTEASEQWLKTVSEAQSLKNPDQVAAQLIANLNLNPVFLLPSQQRISFIKDLQRQGKLKPDFNVDYYLKANLEGYSQKVLDQLQRFYANHPQRFRKMLEHVQVERFHLSGQEFRGLVEVPASRNPDAVLKEIPDQSASSLPASIRALGRRTLDGLMPRAHRGVFYMDDFGRGGHSVNHLLMPLETGEVTIQEQHSGPAITKEQLDFIPMLSVNPEVLENARQQGRFEALEQRMLFVPVPWERRYKVEGQILEPILKRAQAKGMSIAPDTLEAFSLWVTMTRMFPIDQSATIYQDLGKENKKFSAILNQLTPLQKALLYQGENLPNLGAEENRLLKENLKPIANEHLQSLGETEFSLYEGGLGMSNRTAANLLKQMTDKPGQNALSFIDVFESIARYAKQTPQYEQKRAELLKARHKNLDFPSGTELLKAVEDHTRKHFMAQLKTALGMHQSAEVYTDRIQQYNANIEGLKIGQSFASMAQETDTAKLGLDFVDGFEETILGGKRAEYFRQNYRNQFLARAKDWQPHLSEEDNIKRIYRDELDKLRKDDEDRNFRYMDEFRNNVKILLKNPKALEASKNLPAQKRLNNALNHLKALGYAPETLPRILDWALENRYVADQVKA